MTAAQDLDKRVGVGDRRRLVADDDQHVLGRLGELQDSRSDTRRGVDDHDFGAIVEAAERTHQPDMLRFGQARKPSDARCGRHDPEALRGIHDDLVQGTLARQHVRQRVARRNA